MINGAMFVLQGISKSFEFTGVGSAIGVGFVSIWAWLALRGIFERSELAGVGSAVVIRFDYPGLVCNTRDF